MNRQDSNLLRFISNVQIGLNGEVVTNTLDTTPNYISRFYTPNLGVSPLASQTLKKVNELLLNGTTRLNKSTTLVAKIQNSGLKINNPYAYKLTQTIVLEAFSIIYTIEEDSSLLKYTSKKELHKVKENISYLIDALGAEEDYAPIVSGLQEIYIDFGYLEASIESLKGRELYE